MKPQPRPRRTFRRVFTATLGAAALTLTFSGSARAAEGDFTYVFHDQSGAPHPGSLTSPPSRECITLPQVAEEWFTPSADTPRNFTDATATVFTGIDCRGDHFTLRPFGGHASERLKLRSVVFS
ncbi:MULTISPECIES: hypothetical protein [unclassified Streptomyces]|uniref:hypothetical protein n=1 Tax=unclassified Streptomyces TaxID=2593676 RepID=UPI002E0EB6F7|nr:hypothetical protein OG452_00810 [Streptomyces sp. NBC_01197]WSS53265.1 hypothetical protein OG708_34250 [Streptomyces sp. NBC_01180]